MTAKRRMLPGVKSRQRRTRMLSYERMTQTLRLLPFVLLVFSLLAADLAPESTAAFAAYDRNVEKGIRARISSGSVVSLREKARRNGNKAVVESGAEPNPNDVGSAYIHDWLGAIFIPGGTAARVKAILQDFGRHKEYFQPEVIDSRLLSKNGNEFHSALRLRKKKILTVILSSEFTTRFTDLSPQAGFSIARSTKMNEVENAGTPNERDLPLGQGQGFLWNLNSYWSWEEGDGGVYVECRAVSLSRDVPTGLGWVVNPIIRDLPKESLELTLVNTRKAVLFAQTR